MSLSVEGKIYSNGSFEKCCIKVEDGKIKEVKKIIKCDEHIYFRNKLILPAGVDLHVHFRDPGMTHKEDFYHGSIAAAYGGIGCVFDMPNTIPQTTNIQSLEDKINEAGKKSVVDFGIYAGINNENLDKIESIGKKCNGFKIFLGNSTVSMLFDNKKLREAFDLIRLTEKPAFIHAEDEECLIKHKSIEKNLSDHMSFRPSICEEIAIKNILHASFGINSNIHICHLSSCEGLELLKNRARNITCGVTPHHSLLSVDKNLVTSSFYKVNPPIRTSFDKESLFNAVKNGVVDILESDHAPHTQEEKGLEFDEAPSGLPGVETMYPLFLYLVKKEALSLQRLVNMISTKPSDIVGIAKGRIQKGYDADFIVVDMKDDCRIKAENLHYKCGWTPFEDWPAVFPKDVFIRGKHVIQDSELIADKGSGSKVE